MHVYFCTQLSCGKDATQAQEEQDRRTCISPSNMPEVKSVKFVSKAEALKIMQKKSPELTRAACRATRCRTRSRSRRSAGRTSS